MFGVGATYVVCVNSVSVEEARERTGWLPVEVEWRQMSRGDLPEVLAPHFDAGVMEGMGWKLMPLRLFPERYELSLDNDCVIWEMPEGMRRWLGSERAGLLAEDVERCLGAFDALCQQGCFNAGIRGLPPGADLGRELGEVLAEVSGPGGMPMRLEAEIEEQGLQAAAMFRLPEVLLVRKEEVSICSPFWPRSQEFGTCGAHFVGMNARHIPWDYYDRRADVWVEEFWAGRRAGLYEKAGLEM